MILKVIPNTKGFLSFSSLYLEIHENKQQWMQNIFHFAVSNFYCELRIRSKHIWFKDLLLTVEMTTSNLITGEDIVIVFFRDIHIFRFHIITTGFKCRGKISLVVIEIMKNPTYIRMPGLVPSLSTFHSACFWYFWTLWN